MASPSKAATADDSNWLFPLGALGLVLLAAIQYVHDDLTANITQLFLCGGAALVLGWGWVLAEQGRAKHLQRLRDRLLVALGCAGALAYCNFGHLHFGNFVHVWDTYHYYMGAKYFPEVGYDLLYDCAAVADAEDGLRAQTEARALTDLRTNVMHQASEVLQHPEVCNSQFTPQRWASFKHDIAFFRGRVNAKRWEEIHQDHGYNATPVWTLLGHALTNTGPASLGQVTALNLFDPIYLALMALMLWWAFGPRSFAVAMLILGTNFPNRYYWTGGAFLRHDWLFYTVAVVCLLKKDKPVLAGASLAYATLLRLFPGLLAIGPFLAGVEYLRVNKKLDRVFVRFVAGGALGVALLLPASFASFGGVEHLAALRRKHRQARPHPAHQPHGAAHGALVPALDHRAAAARRLAARRLGQVEVDPAAEVPRGAAGLRRAALAWGPGADLPRHSPQAGTEPVVRLRAGGRLHRRRRRADQLLLLLPHGRWRCCWKSAARWAWSSWCSRPSPWWWAASTGAGSTSSTPR